jgi:ubiquinone/menaquinone biosynthesis C-methylase UbiE
VKSVENGESVLDFACGTGELLCGLQKIREKSRDPVNKLAVIHNRGSKLNNKKNY